jgi:ATP-dependent RNA helicase DDX42
MDQSHRNQVLSEFKRSRSGIMVATDVAARGLDIPFIRTVVNYDCARNIETHTHRIGRTGRAGTLTIYTSLCVCVGVWVEGLDGSYCWCCCCC